MLMWIIVISLILIGLALLIVEIIFIPGTTVVGVLGLVFSIVGVIVSYEHFGDEVGFYFLLSTLLATALMLYFSFRTGAWNRFSLKSTIDSKVNEGITATLKVGDLGKTVSTLRPVGKAEFANQTFEVKTLGGYIEPGREVKIIQLEAQQIIVELI